MLFHPSLQLEIARERQQELLAEAGRYRLARSCDHSGAAWLARLPRRRGKRSPVLQDGARPSADPVGSEV
jgi:hypothetical protein